MMHESIGAPETGVEMMTVKVRVGDDVLDLPPRNVQG